MINDESDKQAPVYLTDQKKKQHSGIVWQLKNLHIDKTGMKTSVSLL